MAKFKTLTLEIREGVCNLDKEVKKTNRTTNKIFIWLSANPIKN